MATGFTPKLRETIMVLATLRAAAASHSPGTRLLGNIRCDDIMKSVDALMPLDECWPGETHDLDPSSLYVRRDWRDGSAPDIVMMGILDCALKWVPDANIVGPLRAGEIVSAAYHVLTGRDFPDPNSDVPSNTDLEF